MEPTVKDYCYYHPSCFSFARPHAKQQPRALEDCSNSLEACFKSGVVGSGNSEHLGLYVIDAEVNLGEANVK